MSERDWEVGPVLKNKANSQGTLFRGGTKWSSDKRFPRGYTPGRLNEVANAVVGVVRDQNGEVIPSQSGVRSALVRDRRFTIGGGRANEEHKRRLVDNIARSTVPIEHLQPKPPARQLAFWSFPSQNEELTKHGAAGEYEANPPGHMGTRNDIRIQTGYVEGTTPIHEIGHHVSNLLDNEHALHYNRGPQTRGQEEGFADRYAFEHFRDRRGKRLESLRPYLPNSGQTEGRRADFDMGYWSTRGQDVKAPWYDFNVPHFLRATPPQPVMKKSIFNNWYVNAGDGGRQWGLFQPSWTGSGDEAKFAGWRPGSWQDDDA